MPNERSGTLTTCKTCGRKVVPTGRTKLERATTPVFDHADFRYGWSSTTRVFCGHDGWSEEDPQEPPQ